LLLMSTRAKATVLASQVSKSLHSRNLYSNRILKRPSFFLVTIKCTINFCVYM
jgi:hypothetical protein